MTQLPYLLLLRDGTALARHDDSIQIEMAGGQFALDAGSATVASALERLVSGATEAELAATARSESLPVLYYCLERLRQWNLLDYSLRLDRSRPQGGTPVTARKKQRSDREGAVAGSVRVQPLRGGFRLSRAEVKPDVPYVLSRFAYLRASPKGLTLDSPMATASLLFEGDAGAAVAMWGRPRTLAGATPDLFLIASLLLATKFLESAETTEPEPMMTWEFHDLLFHRSTAAGGPWQPWGRTERFLGMLARPAEHKPPMSSEALVLPPPGAAKLRDSDPPLARVSDERRSLRTPGSQPIALCQLGEFLWRVARVPRTLPAAGGLHELEFYALVDRCDGLAPGLYHYYGSTHALYRLPPTPAAESLVAAAQSACGPERYRPQVVIVVSARFARMAWSYQGIAYRNVLLDVGVAMHAMYLAATAMNLAPCALGWNDPELFATAARLDPLEESSVALFVLSSRPLTAADL